MIATPRLNLDAQLLDSMADGVILLDRQAQVTARNQAALPRFKQVMAPSGAIKSLIDLEVRLRVKLPVKLGSWQLQTDSDKASASVWLIRDGRRDYAIYIASHQEDTRARATKSSESAEERSIFLPLGEAAREQLMALQLLTNPPAEHAVSDSAAIAFRARRSSRYRKSLICRYTLQAQAYAADISLLLTPN